MSRTRILLATPPILAAYTANIWLNDLEERYPPIAPERSSTLALHTPSRASQHVPHVDIYATRIPLRALLARVRGLEHGSDDVKFQPTQRDLHVAWAQSVLGCRTIRAESKIVGLFRRGRLHPGDLGQDGFAPDPSGTARQLMNGVMEVVAEPTVNQPLVTSWVIPDGARVFFERLARWGYPWRLMSGGRHEMSVSEPFEGEGDDVPFGPFVEVRFASAHAYEVVSDEGDLLDQKVIPGWTGRLHRGFASTQSGVSMRMLATFNASDGPGSASGTGVKGFQTTAYLSASMIWQSPMQSFTWKGIPSDIVAGIYVLDNNSQFGHDQESSLK
ncbi:hypothetical protein BDV25DRAFT_142099 [Aspergillus avenaceus]|uniref:Uncharacterized protein n=1 Tax=Aspergillus avenaceus TaxID=36643 RepID=A0A5N6TP09_ASPAV|nr:hypothetical protein BDV25DRAFT_142099 [Aspergillus avenaceus]